MRLNCRHFGLALALVGGLFVLCEFLIYYLVLWKCSYPSLTTIDSENDALSAMFLADTHLLGSRRGHWFDKLRREWQMHRAFQTAQAYFRPDVVFFLGDIFDEGKYCGPEEFDYYVRRFQDLFYVNKKTRIYVVAGNHDIGFHYAVNPYLNARFQDAFSIKAVDLVYLKGNPFVLVNSMAMDRSDKCFLCSQGERELRNVSSTPGLRDPILLQHYPLYRESDSDCDEPDGASPAEKLTPFREAYDCLSQISTKYLLKTLKPRLVLSGHTHNGCQLDHKGIPEITISSFSWRNRNNPAFILARVTPKEFALDKCYLPEEGTVINLYCFGLSLITIFVIYTRRKFYKFQRRRRYNS